MTISLLGANLDEDGMVSVPSVAAPHPGGACRVVRSSRSGSGTTTGIIMCQVETEIEIAASPERIPNGH